jgi:hypothetical protein
MKATAAIARAAGQDAGNRNMKANGRTAWNEADWNVAAETMQRIMEAA